LKITRSVTLTNFDKSTFQPQQPTSQILQDISYAASELEDSPEFQYAQHYPNKFPYFAKPRANHSSEKRL
jgi:hypothetical protein